MKGLGGTRTAKGSARRKFVYSPNMLTCSSVLREWPALGCARIRLGCPGGSSLSRHTKTNTLITIGVALLASAIPLCAANAIGTAVLVVRVAEAEQLQLQGENALLRIRLASGVTANLWADEFCGDPGQQGMVITKSGIYTLPLNNLLPGKKISVCLVSSDGILRESVVGPAVSASPPGTRQNAGPLAPRNHAVRGKVVQP